MRPALFALALLLPITASADRGGDAVFGLGELRQAIKQRDVPAIAERLSTPIAYGALWFPDAACSKRFAKGGVLQTKDRDAFAACLAKLMPQLSTRRMATSDTVVLTVEPGLEIEVAFHSRVVRWIGTPGGAAPLLTAQAFEALRTAGTTLVDAAVREELEPMIRTAGSISVWLKVCLDDKGGVATRALSGSSVRATTAFDHATRDWTFRPWKPRGVATAACGATLLTYPAARAPGVEVLPESGAPLNAELEFGIDDRVFIP